MAEPDPAKQKGLAKQITGDEALWKSQAKQITYKAIKAKFEQHEDLLEYLKSSGSKKLGEASNDRDWGIASSLMNPQCLQSDT